VRQRDEDARSQPTHPENIDKMMTRAKQNVQHLDYLLKKQNNSLVVHVIVTHGPLVDETSNVIVNWATEQDDLCKYCAVTAWKASLTDGSVDGSVSWKVIL